MEPSSAANTHLSYLGKLIHLKNPVQIYKNNYVEVLKGLYEHNGQEKLVAAKILTVDSEDQCQEHFAEVTSTRKTRNIQRCVQVLNVYSFDSHTGHGYDLCIITEFCVGESLDKEIRRRALDTPPQPWTESQLFSFVYNIVEALADCQRLGVCHRDLKPGNIFLLEDGDFKIGDFGQAKIADESTMMATIQGTRSYLSYKLFAAFIDFQLTNQAKKVLHDMFKSDMVSVGLMLLNMARIDEKGVLNNPNDARNAQEVILCGLSYSEIFKNLIRRMLAIEEADRPDFITLHDELKTMGIAYDPISSQNVASMMAQSNAPQQPVDPVQMGNRGQLDPTIVVEDSTISAGVKPGALIRGNMGVEPIGANLQIFTDAFNPGFVLSYLSDQKIVFYDCRTHEAMVKSLALIPDYAQQSVNRYCFIDRENILICGGMLSDYDITNRCYSINVSTFEVINKNSMKHARLRHGLISYDAQSCFTFGGFNNEAYLESSEKFDISSGNWSSLPDMPRSGQDITCVRVRDQILITANEFPLISFNIEHQLYQVIDFVQGDSIRFLACSAGRIFLFQEGRGTWQIDTQGRCLKTLPFLPNQAFLGTNTVTKETGDIYIATSFGPVFKYEEQSGDIVEVFNFQTIV